MPKAAVRPTLIALFPLGCARPGKNLEPIATAPNLTLQGLDRQTFELFGCGDKVVLHDSRSTYYAPALTKPHSFRTGTIRSAMTSVLS